MKRNITMKKPAVFFLCLLSFCAVASAQFRDGNWRDLDDSEVVRSMKEQVEFLSSAALEGRKAGSEGEKAAAEYISGQLSLCGVDVLSGGEGDIFGIRQENGDTLTSRNVIGFIPGYDPELRDSYILIGARMDNLGTSTVTVDGESREKIFYGANGNASGLSMLLQLAAKLNTNRVLLKRSVLLVVFGASVDLCAGSWYFLNRSFPDVGNIDAMINLDMLGTGSNGFYAYTASNVDLNAVITRLSGTLQPVQPQIVSMEPVNSDHRMFYAKEIPSVLFTTGMYPEYNTDRDTAWTLEYEIAGSGLYRLLATAIKAAKMETDQPKAEIDNDALNKLWKEVTEVYPDRRIPTKEETYKIFKPLNDGTVSKAITAQYLAGMLAGELAPVSDGTVNLDEVKFVVENDDKLKYLVEAIKHVTK